MRDSSGRLLSIRVFFFLLIAALAPRHASAQQSLIGAGAAWKYNDSGTNLQTAWRAAAYNDATWATGFAQLGYGDGDESTVISYGSSTSNRRITYYFRRAFTVTNPAAITALILRFVRDDGCVIYLNGVEVLRSNLPTGTIGYTTLATTAIGGADESAWQQSPVDPALLIAGNNVIAVEVHQQSASSSDVSFDLELLATQTAPQPPAMTLNSPANHAISNSTAVTFTGTASAAALSSATLFVGGPPVTVAFSGPAQIQDTQISADQPTTSGGSSLSVNVDGQTPHSHGLIKFLGLTGSGVGQVPAGAAIVSAGLRVNCTNAGNTMRLYRLTEDWVEDQATWNERSTGNAWAVAGADGSASHGEAAVDGDCTVTGQRTFDITSFVQEWSNGAPQYGMVLIDSGTDGVDFDSSESSNSPVLTVVYKSAQQALLSQALSGSSSPVSFSVNLPLGETYFWNIRVTAADGQQAWAPADFELILDAASPNAPVLVSPLDGSGGISVPPALAVTASDPSGGSLSVRFDARRTAAPEFTIIGLPDTQHYSEAYPAIYTAQTQWIVNQKAARNIVFVTHFGDIVEHNSLVSEWEAANTSMSLLDGVVPYGMGPGNHDQPTTLFNQYFPFTRYQSNPWYGGHYASKNDNNYQLFSAGGMDFVIIHMEFCPPAVAVAWADSVLKSYPNRIGIMTTHGYLNESAQRTVSGCSSTQYLWDGLAVPNPNLYFMLSGHVHNEARRIDTANGHPVFQMLADYQDRASGGEGWLRILRLVPAENKVYVQTYSPWLNRYETDADSEFAWDFPMGGALSTLGTVTVPSGATATLSPAGLLPSTSYEWNATVTNSQGKSRTGPTWAFTTGSATGGNQPPLASNLSLSTPEDTALGITLLASDQDNNPLTYSVVNGPAHGSLTGAAPSLTYQPSANYSGADTFTYRANDGAANSNIATVSIAISPVNDPPLATNDSYTMLAGTTLNQAAPGVLGNDSDPDSSGLAAGLLSSVSHGTLTLNSNGSFSYAPTAGYSGPDSFTYNTSDGAAVSNTATVSLTVTFTAGISGTVSPAAEGAGTTLALSGTSSASATADASGNFTFSGLVNGSYTVTPSKSGYTFSPTQRTVTVSGASVSGVSFTATAAPAGQTLFTTQVPANVNDTDGPGVNYEMGTVFTSTAAGQITAIRFWKATSEGTGTHTGRIWSAGGQLLASLVFTGETASGWQQQALATPLNIAAGTSCVVTVNTVNARFAITGKGLLVQVTNGNLRSVVGNNGVFGAPGQFPTSSWDTSNYFRDIVFVASGPVQTYTLSGTVTPTAGGAGTTLALSGTSSASTTADASGNFTFSGLINGSYTVTPSKSGYTFSPTQRTVTISGANVTGVSFTATAAAAGQTLFTTQVPANANDTDGLGVNYEMGTVFTSTAAGQITAIRFWKATSEGTGTHTGRIWSAGGQLLASLVFTGETASGWQQQALATPLNIAAGTSYVVTVNTVNARFAITPSGLASQVTNGNLRSVVGNNGVFGPVGQFPTSSWDTSNYFRDVVFVP